MDKPNLAGLDCTAPGSGPWRVIADVGHRSINVRHIRSGFVHRVYYGTRTARSEAGAVVQATALCALLNALKAKRP